MALCEKQVLEEKRCTNKRCNALLFKTANGKVVIESNGKMISITPENGMVKAACKCGNIYVMMIDLFIKRSPIVY